MRLRRCLGPARAARPRLTPAAVGDEAPAGRRAGAAHATAAGGLCKGGLRLGAGAVLARFGPKASTRSAGRVPDGAGPARTGCP